jgi:hypothetical protein
MSEPLTLEPEDVDQPDGYWHTDELVAALHARHPAPEWAMFFEVRNATGFPRVARSADAIAMNTWVSRGLEVHGFEVKASRSDWRRELKNPAKAEEISKFCDRWWIVAAPKVVKPDELPPTWGLLEPRGRALVTKVEAPKLEAVPMTRGFLAALVRVANESSASTAQLKAAVGLARREFDAERERERKHERDSSLTQLHSLQAAVHRFEEQSGVRINAYAGGQIGSAVDFVLRGGMKTMRRQLEHLRDSARHISEEAARVLAMPDEPAPTKPEGTPE